MYFLLYGECMVIGNSHRGSKKFTNILYGDTPSVFSFSMSAQPLKVLMTVIQYSALLSIDVNLMT